MKPDHFRRIVNEHQYLTFAQAADALKTDERTLRRFANDGVAIPRPLELLLRQAERMSASEFIELVRAADRAAAKRIRGGRQRAPASD